jgi:hypothetical protein
MIKVELLTPNYDGDSVEWKRLALLEAQDDQFTWLAGDESLLDLGVSVVDLRNQRHLAFKDNPEEWVRWLPTLFRGGDLIVNVIEDTNPLPSDLFEMPSDGDGPLELHDPAETRAATRA